MESHCPAMLLCSIIQHAVCCGYQSTQYSFGKILPKMNVECLYRLFRLNGERIMLRPVADKIIIFRYANCSALYLAIAATGQVHENRNRAFDVWPVCLFYFCMDDYTGKPGCI